MTRRRNTRRRRRANDPVVRRVWAVATLAVLGVLGWLALSVYSGVPGRDYRMVEAVVPSTGNLISHDPVRMAGIRIGQVLGVSAAQDGTARLRLQLEPGTTLPRDSTVAIRANGLLGARYVEVLPGKDAAGLPPHTPLRGGPTSMTFGVPEALDTFDAETRGQLGVLVREAGRGLLGQGRPLNDAIGASAPATLAFQRLAGRVLEPDARLDRLVPALGRATAALAPIRENLTKGLVQLGVALQPVTREGRATDALLRLTAPALRAAEPAADAGTALLRATSALSRAAHRALPAAPDGLRLTAALLRESITPLQRTRPVALAAREAAAPARRLLRAVDHTLVPLRHTLDGSNPFLEVLRRYGCNVINLGTTWRSMTGYGGTGSGPAGPAMQFRLQVVPTVPAENVGLPDSTGLLRREGDGAPCTRLASPYPIVGNGENRP